MSSNSNAFESMALSLVIYVVLQKAFEWIYYAVVTFWTLHGVSIMLFIAKLIGGLILLYFAFRVLFSFYQIYWVQMEEAQERILNLEESLKKEVRSLESSIKWVERHYSALPRKTEVLARNVFNLKKFTGLDEVEKVQAAEKAAKEAIKNVEETHED
ncbi:MAG: hypothetical protein KDD50_00630 [Bdellovibrionales bacterium]|nr:hypothetical protein [Bdellovibrionales bacterium]MCB0412806.1 hypothetical protein [Bdellovibrionales bacterium]